MRVLVSWSSGKDSAWTLHCLKQDPAVEIAGLLTTFNVRYDRVTMHGVRRELVRLQADAAGSPLWEVFVPDPCTNEEYEAAMARVLERAVEENISHVAFGDIHLEDVRAYREKQLTNTPIEPLFPLWGRNPEELALEMVRAGVRAIIVCVDTNRLAGPFLGRIYDEQLIRELPKGVDPCGEQGEFHTFCYGGPMFRKTVPIKPGETVLRDRFEYLELLPAAP